MENEYKFAIASVGVGLIILLVSLWGLPRYQVYCVRLRGEAELAQAQYTRQVAEANANTRSCKKEINNEH